MKLIYVSWITSPFWLELFEEYHLKYGVNCKVIECQNDLDGRGKHWEKSKQRFIGVDRKKIEKGQLLESFLDDNIVEEAPDLVLISGFDLRIMRYVSKLVKKSVKHRNLKIVIVAEQPNKANRIISLAKRIVYRTKITWFRPHAILAIGLRAYDFYLSISGKETYVCEFPYFQNNAPYQIIESNLANSSEKLNLLFCGQLIERNNPKIIVDALCKLPASIRKNIILRISGGGPLLGAIIKDLQESGFDMNNLFQVSEFDVWEERMTYYTESHILICPANHSGWGLVIPEALSCSVVLLVTEKMEAARYFLRDHWNGIFIKEDAFDLSQKINYLFNNREILEAMRLNAKTSARDGNVQNGAFRLNSVINFIFFSSARNCGRENENN